MLKVKDLRDSFIDFFKNKKHKIIPSSSLLPKDDPTLLFTTAGMVQFKPMFAGIVDLEYTRAASIQKCLRTSDLENVGKTKRHLTFFEMLGNFSFGDYFKKEAIEFAWDFSTGIIGFPKEKIWISIFLNDDEAFEIWHKHIGISKEKIVRLGKEDNFWGPAGDSGACGPCSELYLDRGEAYGCGSPDCKPGCECDRFMEYWNLVFNQFNQDVTGALSPLPQTGIDTGMGLERLATLVQNVDSVFEIDEMKHLINVVSEQSKKPYEDTYIVPMRIIIEHARSLSFAMSDGIYPSNDGRGYVLRRILRRALRFTRQLEINKPFIFDLIDPIINVYGKYYPNLAHSAKNIKSVIESEERRFLETLDNGIDRLEEIINGLRAKRENTISGKDAFILYDTFGFPLEMTIEMANEQDLSVDAKGYELAMEEQRSRGKQSWKGADSNLEKAFETLTKEAGDTRFTGYDENDTPTSITGIFAEGKLQNSLSEGIDAIIVTKDSAFYGESGGQSGDIGKIYSDTGSIFTVSDTKKYNKTIMHIGSLTQGKLAINEKVNTKYDTIARNLIRANHTVTHLLQSALRNTLGNHVKQSGSLVEADRLRFDFSHFNAMTAEEIKKIETEVNEKIWERIPVCTEIMELNDAIKKGAMAVFDEKYEDQVRVIQVGDYSLELCGGTHVFNTGEIGIFKILKEASPGAGIRRIEAITLRSVLTRFNEQETILKEASNIIKVSEKDLIKKIEDLIQHNKKLEKEMEKIKKESLATNISLYIEKAENIKGLKIIGHVFDGIDTNELRNLSDAIREKEQNSVVCFGSNYNGKALLMYAATNNAVKSGIHCGTIIKETSKLVNGGGGGRPDMAQAGGNDPNGLENAIKQAVAMAKKMVK